MPVDPVSFGPMTNYVGKSQYADPNFNGRLDDLVMLGYAMNAAQVAALMNGRAPGFVTDPFTRPTAVPGVAYNQALAGSAFDPNPGTELRFTKVSGPAWMTVGADGRISGMPGAADAGVNRFVVRATDPTLLADDAVLNIAVQRPEELVAQYAFDGTGANHAGGSAAVFVGGPVFGEGIFDRAVEFDGVDDRVTLASGAAAGLSDATFAVRVRWDAAVVTGLLRDDLDGFGRNWMATSWRYGAAVLEEEWRIRVPVPVYVGLCEVGAEEVGAAMVEGPDGSCAVVTLMPVAGWPGPDAGEPYWTAALGASAVRAETEWLIYVDPMMHPSSGAELFLGHRMRGGEETDVYAPGWAFRRIGVEESEWIGWVFGGDGLEGGVVPVPEDLELGRLLRHVRLGPPATMVRREVMKDVLAEWLAMAGDMPFEVFLTLRLWREAVRRGGSVRMTRHTGAGVEVCRPVEWGWRL
jgi:hypothetical protein